MLYRADDVQTRQYCHNTHCGARLLKEAENTRSRFCCEACERIFYRERCRVCERPLPEQKTARRQLCGRSKCRHEMQRHPERFVSAWWAPQVGPNRSKTGSRYLPLKVGPNDQKSLTKSKGRTAAFGDRPWRVVAGPMVSEANLRVGLDQATEARQEQNRKALREHFRKLGERCLYQRNTPPTNIIGGCKFPGAPVIDLSPISKDVAPTQPTPRSADRPIPDNLSIPDWLRRT